MRGHQQAGTNGRRVCGARRRAGRADRDSHNCCAGVGGRGIGGRIGGADGGRACCRPRRCPGRREAARVSQRAGLPAGQARPPGRRTPGGGRAANVGVKGLGFWGAPRCWCLLVPARAQRSYSGAPTAMGQRARRAAARPLKCGWRVVGLAGSGAAVAAGAGAKFRAAGSVVAGAPWRAARARAQVTGPLGAARTRSCAAGAGRGCVLTERSRALKKRGCRGGLRRQAPLQGLPPAAPHARLAAGAACAPRAGWPAGAAAEPRLAAAWLPGCLAAWLPGCLAATSCCCFACCCAAGPPRRRRRVLAARRAPLPPGAPSRPARPRIACGAG
jgi:hypothetical protein